jgi:hypothetical protein
MKGTRIMSIVGRGSLLSICLITLALTACDKLNIAKFIKEVSNETPAKLIEQDVSLKPKKQAYELCKNCLLLPVGQTVIRSNPGKIKGIIETIKLVDDKIRFQGWAADLKNKKPVKEILVFSDEKLVLHESSKIDRLDITQLLGIDGVVNFGFDFTLDKNLFVEPSGKEASILVFAIGADGAGAKLPFKRN